MTSCSDIESEIRLFADGWVCYREIKDIVTLAQKQCNCQMSTFQERQKTFLFQTFTFNHIKNQLSNMFFVVLIKVYRQFVKVRVLYNFIAETKFSYNVLALKA